MNTILSKGIGKRKTSVATVYLTQGSGKITLNKTPFSTYLQSVGDEANSIKKPLYLVNLEDQYNLDIFVKGGGVSGQIDAIRLALSRALSLIDPINFRPILRKNLCLRRDSRIKERRKYGLKKARKASQYSKR
jgi:small subunit ribosomal protein S9